jgi:hypothetical protein
MASLETIEFTVPAHHECRHRACRLSSSASWHLASRNVTRERRRGHAGHVFVNYWS